MIDIPTFAGSIAGLVAALGGLLGGLASLVTAIAQARQRRVPAAAGRSPRPLLVALLGLPLFELALILILGSAYVFVVRGRQPLPLPHHAELVSAAWNALAARRYSTALSLADQCIGKYGTEATRDEAGLRSGREPLPKVGAVSGSEAQVMLSRGVLNDVAVSYDIMGRSLEELQRIPEAKQAYEHATQYEHARAWDPRGWFWSPADHARDRLSVLN